MQASKKASQEFTFVRDFYSSAVSAIDYVMLRLPPLSHQENKFRTRLWKRARTTKVRLMLD